MKETGLQGKACMVPVTVAAVLGMAGMGLVSMGIAAADTVTDTINITVQPSCTFTNVSDETYAGSAANGTQVNNFNDNGQHVFNIFCNDHNGFEVSATAYDLEATGVEDVIAYTDNYTHTGVDSMWTAGITSSSTGVTVVPVVPIGGGTIFSSDTNTSAAGVSFTATYSAYVGTATPAGTYTGTIVYTLTASGTSNSNSGNGGSGSGAGDNSGSQQDNGGGDNSGTNSGNEEPGTGTEEPGSGAGDNSGSGAGDNSGSGTGDNSGSGSNQDANSGSGSNPSNTNSTPSNTNAAPLSMNSFYNTYNTSNTTNTTNTYNTNYSGGSSAPAATSGQTATTGTNDTTGNDTTNSNNTGAGDSYEQPLGVMSTTSSSSDKNSGMDPMPIVAAGALTMAGVAAIALARSGKKEEE